MLQLDGFGAQKESKPIVETANINHLPSYESLAVTVFCGGRLTVFLDVCFVVPKNIEIAAM